MTTVLQFLMIGMSIFLVCYLIARFRSVASLLGSVSIWLANQLTVVASVCSQLATNCQHGCIAILSGSRCGESLDREHGWNLVSVALIRFLYLIISLCILLG